jgi:hypothetical protein
MPLPDFEIHLGGGVYIDSAGNVRRGAQPTQDVPVYSPPFALPVDPAKLKDSVSSVEKALKGFTSDPDVRAKFERFGYASKILDVLAGAAAIASVIAPVLSVAAFAVSILKMFGLFKGGPTAFEASVQRSLETLQDSYRIVFDGNNQLMVEQNKAYLSDAWKIVEGYYLLLKNGNPSIEQAQRLFDDMNSRVLGTGPAVDVLLGQLVWSTIFDRNSHTLWAFHQNQMTTLSGPSSTPAKAYFPPDERPAFDHRMMLPIVIFAANAYLACLRGAHPEYRSTGEFAPRLRAMADKLDDLAESMRSFGLGRLVYRPEDFRQVSSGDLNLMKLGDRWIPLGVKRTCAAWPVGALDLRYHDDAFFAGFLAGLVRAEITSQPHPTKMAGIDFRWAPPARIESQRELDGKPGFPPATFRILNPEECAAAANAISENEYADLLSVSGYLELLRVAALVRNEATEPRTSQTVAVRQVATYRDPQPPETVEISSGGRGWVEKTVGRARRVPQKSAVDITVSTQPVKRPWPIQYKVYLRALNHDAISSWTEREYADYCYAAYNATKRPSSSGGTYTDQNLTIQKFDGLMLDERLIASGTSSFERAVEEREIDLKVDTFDWWIPELTPSFQISPADLAAATSGLNWFDTTAGPPAAGPDGVRPELLTAIGSWSQAGVLASTLNDLRFIGWQNGDKTWDGQKREARRLTARIKYRLAWQGDRLRLQLETRPEDRNFTVFLVIEELLPSTGSLLHTAIPISANGSLTYVPQEFFEREAKAIAAGGKAIAAFYKRRVVEPTGFEPSPEPTFTTISPTDLFSLEKVTRLSTQLQGMGVSFQEMIRLGR